MTGESILIAGYSGRALAQSARRAGYVPLVVDCFGDEDLKIAAGASRVLPGALQSGFHSKPLLNALDALIAEASSPPVGLVIGAGFEDNADLVELLDRRYRVLGCPSQSVRKSKDARYLFKTLDRLGIRYPETRFEAPTSTPGWLVKRAGGSGGLHVCPADRARPPTRNTYWQRSVEGDLLSMLGLASPTGPAFAFSRQWIAPSKGHPFRYGGAVQGFAVEEDLEARIIDIALALSDELGLSGLVSFDIIVVSGEPLLIDVNPRPGATLDIFDDARGTLFSAHLAAAAGQSAADVLQRYWQPPPAKAAAYLYADAGRLEIGEVAWPEWVNDRPLPGSRLLRHQPVATVTAVGKTADEAERLCRERLGALEKMLYENQNGEDQAS